MKMVHLRFGVARRAVGGALMCFALTALPSFAPAATVDTRSVSALPKEVYGALTAPIILRIGNGGAGPTGVLRALANDYLQMNHRRAAIAWYQDISPNTLRQLRSGVIDVALVYEPAQEKAALAAGYASNNTVIFNDHFLIAGPKDNPAHVLPTDSPAQAFAKIARLGEKLKCPVFLSRDDHSATNEKERKIWTMAGLKPWSGSSSWYFKRHEFPKPALREADSDQIYTLTDHGTWVSSIAALTSSKILVMGGDLLRNPCNALLRREPTAEAAAFLEYLKSPRAQNVIAHFGEAKFHDAALFTKAAQGDFTGPR